MSGSVTREQYLESIQKLKSAAAGLSERFNMHQLTWQPQNGERWSMLECLDHITVASDIYLDAMQAAVTDARPGSGEDVFRTGGWLSSKIRDYIEPPPRSKGPAPAKMRPRPTLKPEGILPQFMKVMDRTTALVASSSGRDLNSVRFKNPLVPLIRFTVATGFLVIAAHGRRHLWQAEQVAGEPDFPAIH